MQTRKQKTDNVKKAPIPAQPRTVAKDRLTKKNMQRVFDALHDHPIDKSDAGRALSFKLALPGLDSHANIKSFIGHVAQGIALGIFTGREGSQLLYAAQVALGALRGEPSAPAKSSKTPENGELFTAHLRRDRPLSVD
jgi:hypothetical protein